jgi:hypothetical protein
LKNKKTLHERLFPALAEVKYNPLASYSAKRGLKEIKKWEGRGYTCIHESPNGGHRIYKSPELIERETRNALNDCLAVGGIQTF